MNFRFILLIFIITFSVGELAAQRWKATRQELYGGLAASNFIGELGGADSPGSLAFIRNLNVTDTRPGVSLGYRYKLSERFTAKAGYNFGILYGDDSKTNNVYRNVRNLSFRAPIHELSVTAEFYYIPEQTGQISRFKGVKSAFFSHISAYAFAGVGVAYFNPQAFMNGKWHDLQPLGTEGQGLRPDLDFYSLYTIVIPYGGGFRYNLSRQLGICFEYGSRLTFTDYMDDVSTTYYDNDLLRAARGDLAADLADRNPNPELASWTGPDQQRGNPDSNDFYLFATATITYKILKGKSVKPRF